MTVNPGRGSDGSGGMQTVLSVRSVTRKEPKRGLPGGIRMWSPGSSYGRHDVDRLNQTLVEMCS